MKSKRKRILGPGINATCPKCGESMCISDEYSFGMPADELMEPKEINGELIVEVPETISLFCSCEHEYVFRVVIKKKGDSERKKR
jgi:hypothetical protein